MPNISSTLPIPYTRVIKFEIMLQPTVGSNGVYKMMYGSLVRILGTLRIQRRQKQIYEQSHRTYHADLIFSCLQS